MIVSKTDILDVDRRTQIPQNKPANRLIFTSQSLDELVIKAPHWERPNKEQVLAYFYQESGQGGHEDRPDILCVDL